MMSKQPFPNFKKKFDIVGCFIECKDLILLLHRQPHKVSGNTWGLPAGKADKDETIHEAILRETFEETGITLTQDDIIHLDSMYVREGELDIEWHIFRAKFKERPNVTTNPEEHSKFQWVTLEKACQMPLIHDLKETIEILYPSLQLDTSFPDTDDR